MKVPETSIKHATASAYVFHHHEHHGWRTGLIHHPVFDRWMQPGGHVEPNENPEEAALREAGEETGLTGFRLWQPHSPLPSAATDVTVTPPCWIMEHAIPGDNQLSEPHTHIDFKYVALVTDIEPVGRPAHPFDWWTPEALAQLSTFEDVRNNLQLLFRLLASSKPESIASRLPNSSIMENQWTPQSDITRRLPDSRERFAEHRLVSLSEPD